MTVLDRSRPYGQCFGAENGARFVQDGREFDGGGRLIESAASVATPAVETPAVTVEPAVVAPMVADQGAIGDIPLNTEFSEAPGHVELAKSAMLRNTAARRGGRPRKGEVQ